MEFSDAEFINFINKNEKLYEQEKNNIVECTSKTCSNSSCGVVKGSYRLQSLIDYITGILGRESPCSNITIKSGIFSLDYNCSERHNTNIPEQLYCKLNIPIQEQLSLFMKEICEIT